MKKIFLSALILSLLYALPAFAGDTLETMMKRAAGGDVKSQFDLGMIYHSGSGVQQDYKKAVEWYEKAAAAGDAESEYNLCMIHIGGQLGSRDYEKGFKYCESAAFKGHALALWKLSMMYSAGVGAPKDPAAAYAFLCLSAANGNDRVIKSRDKMLKKLSEEQVRQAQKMIVDISKKIEENKKTKK